MRNGIYEGGCVVRGSCRTKLIDEGLAHQKALLMEKDGIVGAECLC